MRVFTESFFERFYTSAPQFPKVLRSLVSTAAATTVLSTDYIVPVGYDLVLEYSVCSALPGAAQTLNLAEWYTLNVLGTNPLSFYGDSTVGAVATVTKRNFKGPIHVLSGEKVRVAAYFNAGVAVNSISVTYFGYLVNQTPLLTSS